MRTSIILNIIFLILLASCNNKESRISGKNNAVIEIYYPKKRLQSFDGIELPKETNTFRRPFSEMDSIELLHIRYDTIKDRPIFAGQFKATKSDLSKKPIIKDSEILGFDFKTNELILSQSGAAKIYEQGSNFWFSNQFIITLNRKPILTGYFFNTFSSSYVDAFQIEYLNYSENVKNRKGEHRFVIRSNPLIDGINEYNKLPDLKANSEFYNAFKNR